jgi:predicted PurR-regulated permease PerM
MTSRLSWGGIDTTADLAVLTAYLLAVDVDLQSVFFGNILNAIVTGAIGAIVFSLVDVVAPTGLSVPYPALTGLLAGAASLIPIIGMKIVYLPVAGYLALRASVGGGEWWFVGLFLAAALIVVDTVPDLLIRPYVSSGGSISLGRFGRDPDDGDKTDDHSGLHTGMLMIAYVLGPFLFGWYGLFLAPMLLVLVVHFARFVFPELLAGRDIQPQAVDPTNLIGADDTVNEIENTVEPPGSEQLPPTNETAEPSSGDPATD